MKTNGLYRTLLPLLALVGIFMLGSGNSYGQVFDKGVKQVNLGIGFAGGYASTGSTSSTPPISGSFELGVTDKISVGALVGYSSASYNFGSFFGSSFTYDETYLLFGARGSYHFAGSDKTDFYGGLMLGYNSISTKYNGSSLSAISASASGMVIGLYVGGRYMFTDNIGAYAEIGYSIALINLGLTAKF